MRRIILPVLFLLCLCAAAQAKARVYGYIEQEGQKASTLSAGSNIKAQKSFPGATVTVYIAGTHTLASICSDNASSCAPQSNPFKAGSDGSYDFYVSNGRYDLRFSGAGMTTQVKGDVIAFDQKAEFIDVTNYGVKGNGSDDTVALQSAFDHYIQGVPIIYPSNLGGVSLISATLRANNKKNFILVCGFATPDSYSGQKCKLNWTGSPNQKMLEMINSSSPLVRGFEFNFSNGASSTGAAWGIFATGDFNGNLSGVSVRSGSSSVTISGLDFGSMIGTLPNGENYMIGRTVTLNGAGPGKSNLKTTITAVADATHFTIAASASTTVAGGTGTVVSPYEQNYPFTSPRIEDCMFNWGSVKTPLAYRAALVFDLYYGGNGERIQLRNITIDGNGYAEATKSSQYGAGIVTGRGYASSNFNGPLSPFSSSFNGGSNLLQCSADHIFLYGVSFGFHGWCGTANHIQGSFLQVAFFARWPTIISDSRFEGTRQFANGGGNTTFIGNQWASAVAGVPLIENSIPGSAVISLINNRRDFGGIYDGTGTKTFHNSSGTLDTIFSFGTDSVDAKTSARSGTDYTASGGGANTGMVMQSDITFLGNYPVQYPHWNSSFGPLPARPNGSAIFCDDCVKGTNPCTVSGGTGAVAVRINNVWRCD